MRACDASDFAGADDDNIPLSSALVPRFVASSSSTLERPAASSHRGTPAHAGGRDRGDVRRALRAPVPNRLPRIALPGPDDQFARDDGNRAILPPRRRVHRCGWRVEWYGWHIHHAQHPLIRSTSAVARRVPAGRAADSRQRVGSTSYGDPLINDPPEVTPSIRKNHDGREPRRSTW